MKMRVIDVPLDPVSGRYVTAELDAALSAETVAAVDHHALAGPEGARLVVVLRCDEALAEVGDPAPRAPRRFDWARDLREDDHACFQQLRDWRNERAEGDGVAGYRVLTNRCLGAIAALRPRSLDELAEVPGLGPVRIARYGVELLAVLAAGGDGT